ncbi:MAG TPA: Bax inhibitor-1/YccA family protein [Rubricoccaceae bacterium]|nr:Bax inhibitor-1/YccA family protein [Rubricoccaceae bacterium]
MRTSNPTLRDSVFRDAPRTASGDVMTVQGAVNKTALLLLILVVPALWVWNRVEAAPESVGPIILLGVIGGLIAALVTIFKKTWAPITAPIYAALEGLALGGISAFFEMQFPGIVIQAVGLTFGTLGALLFAYRTGMIRATENFKMGVVAATGGIALVYLVSLVMGFFGTTVPFIHESGPIGIGFSVFVVVIAALNLVLDFDFIEQGAEAGAPKYMEWYASFGLLVTLVWLYLEILRLLAKLQSRD